MACREETAATTVVLHRAGHQAVFRHGVATDPVRLHAWVDVTGRPVAEPDYVPPTDPVSDEQERELGVPWSDPELTRARIEVFLAALERSQST